MQEAIITPEVQDFLSSLLKYRAVKVVYCLYQLVANIISYFLDGHAIVALGHKIVLVAGRIAESALLGATLWVTAHYVAHDFMESIVGGKGNANTLSSLSTLAFSLLPEVIVFSAIVITYEHWHNFFRDRRWLNPSWVWAGLYTVPTCTFVTMTVIVLCSFAVDGLHTPQATGQALVVRYLAGWAYSIIGLIYSRIGKRSKGQSIDATGQPQSVNQTPDYSQLLDQMRSTILAEMQSSLSSLRNDLSAQIDSKIVQPEALDTDAIAASIMPVIETKLSGLQPSLDLGQLATELAPLVCTMITEDDTLDAPIDLESRRVTRSSNDQIEGQEYDHSNERSNDHENEQRDTTPLAPTRSIKRSQPGSSKLTKVRNLVKRNGQITPAEIAQKVQISESYARKLKAKVLEEKPA